jgi:hypothetical protein
VVTRCHGGGEDDDTSGPSTGFVTTVLADSGSAAGRAGLAGSSSDPGAAGVLIAVVLVPSVRSDALGSAVVFEPSAGSAVDGSGSLSPAGLADCADVPPGRAGGLTEPFDGFGPRGRSDSPAGDAVATERSSRVVSAGTSAVSGLSGEVTSCP